MQTPAIVSRAAQSSSAVESSANDAPLGKLSKLPPELLCHHVLPYAASGTKFYTRFAETCRAGRTVARQVAAHVFNAYTQQLIQGATGQSSASPQQDAVRLAHVDIADAKRAEQYLKVISGTSALQRAFRLTDSRPVRALALFEDVLERWPGTPGVSQGMANAHCAQGKNRSKQDDSAGAERHFRLAHALAPEHYETNLALSSMVYARGEHADAITFFARLDIRGARNKDWLVDFGEAQLALFQFEGAEATFRRALKHGNTNREALLGLGFSRQLQQDYVGAEQWYSKGAYARTYDQHSIFLFLQGETYRLRGMWDEAIQHYDAAELRQSKNRTRQFSSRGPRVRALYEMQKKGEIFWRRAEARGKLADVTGALADLFACIKLGRDDEHVYVALGEMHGRNGQPERASEAYRIALEKNPDNLDALLGSLCVPNAQSELLFASLWSNGSAAFT